MLLSAPMFRLKRYKEWLEVLKEEFGEATVRDKLRLVWSMVKVIGGSRGKEVARK